MARNPLKQTNMRSNGTTCSSSSEWPVRLGGWEIERPRGFRTWDIKQLQNSKDRQQAGMLSDRQAKRPRDTGWHGSSTHAGIGGTEGNVASIVWQ